MRGVLFNTPPSVSLAKQLVMDPHWLVTVKKKIDSHLPPTHCTNTPSFSCHNTRMAHNHDPRLRHAGAAGVRVFGPYRVWPHPAPALGYLPAPRRPHWHTAP